MSYQHVLKHDKALFLSKPLFISQKSETGSLCMRGCCCHCIPPHPAPPSKLLNIRDIAKRNQTQHKPTGANVEAFTKSQLHLHTETHPRLQQVYTAKLSQYITLSAHSIFTITGIVNQSELHIQNGSINQLELKLYVQHADTNQSGTTTGASIFR